MASNKDAKIVSTATHPLILSDGSILAPGESRSVDMNDAIQRGLYFDGHLSIIDGFTPRARREDDLAALDETEQIKADEEAQAEAVQAAVQQVAETSPTLNTQDNAGTETS